MTPQRLADALETLADGPPWDTGWLRTILPELAVRGRLVRQESVRRHSTPSSQESPSPAGWVTTSLEEALGSRDRVSDGPFGSKLKSTNYRSHGRRVIRLGNIGIGVFKHTDQAYISPDYFDSLSAYHLQAGDVLVASLGDRPGRSCIVPPEVLPALHKADCFRVRTDPLRLSQHYLVIALNSDAVNAIARDLKRGDTRGRITLSHLRGLPLPLPPLAEQHRIVAKVDELIGHAAVLEERHLAASSARVHLRDAAQHVLAEAEDHEAVETAWQRIEEHFEDLFTEPEDIQPLRQTILQLAVRGRLVRQEEGDEPAERLMERLESDGHEGLDRRVAKMLAELTPVDATEATFALPEGWTWTRLGRIAEPKAGFAFKSNAFNTAGEGLPLIRIRDVLPGRSETYYSGEYRDEFVVNDGDLLVGMDGRFCVAFWKGGTALLNQRVTRLDWYTDLVLPEFVCWAFSQRLADLQDVKSYTTVDHLSGGQIAATPIPIPPLPEQHRIVAKVDELMGLCDTLEASLTRAKAAREQFAASISDAIGEASLPIPTIGSRG